ncbi:GGDEF domain-containing protein [Enterovibrio norvegicus]|uniref:diguanylate cyclase n=1 Tax=Enterovibrio norvegicus TaxID=188144 RepID=A0A2N7L9M7_9GAMM|nr:GGDEF domain-containing protein [Enterovibrio norvegicus]PMN91271.1 diguanylate cyclase [Enterovibrio norvegicus]
MQALDSAFCLSVNEVVCQQKDTHSFCLSLAQTLSNHADISHLELFVVSGSENSWHLLTAMENQDIHVHVPAIAFSKETSTSVAQINTWLAADKRIDVLGSSHLLIDLSVRGDTFGCLAIRFSQPLDANVYSTLTMLATFIAGALDGHLQHDALEREKSHHDLTLKKWHLEVRSQKGLLEQLHILHKISMRLWHAHSLDNMLHTAVYECIHALDFDRMAIFLVNNRTGILRGTYGTDVHGVVTNEQWYSAAIDEHYHAKKTLDRRQHITINEGTPLYHASKEVGVGWNATISLWDSDEAIGWIACDNLLTGTPLKSYHSELLKLLGVTMSQHLIQRHAQDDLKALNQSLEHRVAERTAQLENANKRLNQISREDSLTQVPNRRMLDEKLEEEWRRARRYHMPLSMLIVDIDHFKQYNDKYGHALGDLCLMKVASALSKVERRAGALFARFGGEEFVYLLPGCDSESASAIAQRALNAVRKLQIMHETSPVSPCVTISIGGKTTIPDRASNQQQLFIDADVALYEAKSSGKDCAFVL